MRGDWVMHVASNCDFPQVTVRLVVHYVSDSGGMARSSILVRRPERVKSVLNFKAQSPFSYNLCVET